MGNELSVSTSVERLVHSVIYNPPPLNYMRRSCIFARTRDGDSITMRLYNPDPDVVVTTASLRCHGVERVSERHTLLATYR